MTLNIRAHLESNKKQDLFKMNFGSEIRGMLGAGAPLEPRSKKMAMPLVSSLNATTCFSIFNLSQDQLTTILTSFSIRYQSSKFSSQSIDGP